MRSLSDRCICININAPPKTQRRSDRSDPATNQRPQPSPTPTSCRRMLCGTIRRLRASTQGQYYNCSKSIEATRRRGGSAVQLTVNPPNIVAPYGRRWTAVCNLYHISSSLCKPHDMSVWPALFTSTTADV